MAFIPFANTAKASASIPQSQKQYSSIVPFANNASGVAAASRTPGYQVAAANQSAGSGGGGGGGYDPYALWGGQAAYNSLVDTFNKQKGNIYGTARDAAANTGIGLRGSILDFLDSMRTGQQAIDSKASRNELAKMQGVQGVNAMVGRGIKSGGVQLANRNAGDSSAAQALATAYGDIGRQQLGDVGNQYEMGNEDIKLQQQTLDTQRASGARKIGDSKAQAINNIVAEARDKFAALDADAAGKSLPQRIAIDQEKEAVRREVLGMLQQYDQQLQSGLEGIKATDADTRRAEAQRLRAAGTSLGKDAFDFTTETPIELQGTGPFASELPLFSLRKNRQQV